MLYDGGYCHGPEIKFANLIGDRSPRCWVVFIVQAYDWLTSSLEALHEDHYSVTRKVTCTVHLLPAAQNEISGVGRLSQIDIRWPRIRLATPDLRI